MKMIKAIVRPERSGEILVNLNEAGFPAATQVNILGRGKQQGLKVGDIQYDEIPKVMIMVVAEDDDVAKITKVIETSAKTGKEGAYGDGKIFIIPVETAITISSGEMKL